MEACVAVGVKVSPIKNGISTLSTFIIVQFP
jgi:hypothetical protein